MTLTHPDGVFAMIRNVGTIDRILRVGAGCVLVALAFAEKIGPWGYIGIVPLLTGLMGNCPAYMLFGIKTCAVGAAPSAKGPR
jgi:hypothetical protein